MYKNNSVKLKRSLLTIAIASSSSYLTAPEVVAKSYTLDEIVVTANKTEESIQDVGSTVNALPGEAVDKFNLVNFVDIETLTSGLSLNVTNPRNQSISLRGISYDQDSAASPAVDTYWNDIAIGPNVAFSEMFDMERIEVLRGPQGSLQGRTSPAGSIAFITRKPHIGETEGYVQGSLSGSGYGNTQFGVTLPLHSDSLAVRLAGFYSETEFEQIENLTTGREQNSHGRGMRVSLVWEPLENFSASLVVQNDESYSDSFEDIYGSDAVGSIPFLSPTVKPDIGKYDRKTLAEGNNSYEKRNTLSVLTLNWELADVLLTGITGYQENDQFDYRDLDYANVFEGQKQNEWVESRYRTVSQELRASGSAGETWDWMVGAYYDERISNTDFERDLFPNNNSASTVSVIPLNSRSYGVFSFNTFDLRDDFRVQAGLRWQNVQYFRKSSVYVGQNDGTFGPLPSGFFLQDLIYPEQQDTEEQAFTGSLKAMYDLNEDVMLYASYDHGFRSGGLTISVALTKNEFLLFDSEQSDAVELGFKSTLMEGRVILNGSVYYQQFDGYIGRAMDIPVDDNLDGIPDSANIRGLTFNADATILGTELQLTIRPVENWTLNAGVSYNDAKYDEGAEGPCADTTQLDGSTAVAFCDIGGQRVGSEPNLSANLSSEYSLPIANTEAFVRAAVKYSGARAYENVPDGDVPGYTVTNLYAGLRSPDNRWEMSVWAKNVFDQEAERGTFFEEKTQLGINTIIGTGYTRPNTILPREVGVTARYNFQ